MHTEHALVWPFDVSESVSPAGLKYLLADVPIRARELMSICSDEEGLLATLGHAWASLHSNRLLKLPKYRRQRAVIVDAPTAAADCCRS